MCTVTFVPVKDKFFITSNRDEKILRKPALPPAFYKYGNAKILFPKDMQAKGTWIGMHENGNAVVLLNGGFVKHTPSPPYAKSRGVVLLEIISDDIPFKAFQQKRLSKIEPFTLVLLQSNELYECRWDGNKKHVKNLNTTKPYIWSSVTLYNKSIIEKREQWFNAWLEKNTEPTMQHILDFHLFGGDGDHHNDLRMNRNGAMLTVSVTAMEISNSKGSMQYLDLANNQLYKQQLHFTTALTIS